MDTFSALADPTRRNIVELLAMNGELSTTDISHNFHFSQPAISQHLKILREAKIVEMEKRAQKHVYKINRRKLQEIEKWAQSMTKVWNASFDRLEKVLQKQKEANARPNKPTQKGTHARAHV